MTLMKIYYTMHSMCNWFWRRPRTSLKTDYVTNKLVIYFSVFLDLEKHT
jgi:hypothetical protein